ncbi:hypothetical protein Lal_00006795 [Lupinus albus]|uniref:Uncharacterized protein n=1 Tax=Lupinus albus TaxID=3870 RepID=A0A6A5MN01_LUPAL|nr:hypothetical protein Lalb_Chr07g0178311 [Lupinus albus]KAF1876164.1 hypothetical protein Lal_00006795 [Lupinus albus]
MESRRENSSSGDLRTGPAANLGDQFQHTSPLTEQGHGSIINNHLGTQPSALGNNTIPTSSLSLSSSSQSPSLVPISDHAYQSSSANPFQNQPLVDENVPMKVQGTPPKGPAKSSNNDDIPINSSGSNMEYRTNNKGPEIQNPPVQVMERQGQGDSSTNSPYTFPSHVFARNNTNAPVEWSTASNESLFSIYMGNMSFSNEIPNFSGGNKYTELDKPGGETSMFDQPPNVASSPNHQPPAETTPVNKFNDISQRTAEMHVECSKAKATEAKAFETMREVIMETSRTNENAVGKGGDDKNSNTRHQSDGSTQSFAFQSSVSSKGEEKKKQHKQIEKEQEETTTEVDETSKSTTNPPSKGWLTCFSCCSTS